MDISDLVLSVINLCPMRRLMISIVVGIATLIGIHYFYPDSELLKKIGPIAIGILIFGGIAWDIFALRREERIKLDGKKK